MWDQRHQNFGILGLMTLQEKQKVDFFFKELGETLKTIYAPTPHFTGGEMDAQTRKGTCQRPLSKSEAGQETRAPVSHSVLPHNINNFQRNLNGMLLSNKKEQSTDICYNMDGS